MQGNMYIVEGRHYADSQALLAITAHAHVEPLEDGWRVTSTVGACRCTRVSGRPELPHQRGGLYELNAEGVHVGAVRAEWLGSGRVVAQDAAGAWAKACGTKACGTSCGCGPCQMKHHHPAKPKEGQQ